MIVRISKGRFDSARAAEVEARLRESERSLTPALNRLKGLIGYYVTVDREAGTMTNTSAWETLPDAMQMATLPEMLALREAFTALAVEFEPITNQEVLWHL